MGIHLTNQEEAALMKRFDHNGDGVISMEPNQLDTLTIRPAGLFLSRGTRAWLTRSGPKAFVSIISVRVFMSTVSAVIERSFRMAALLIRISRRPNSPERKPASVFAEASPVTSSG